MKKLIRRAVADADIEVALEYYLANTPKYALDFIDDIEQAYLHIQQFPSTGSLRYAYELNIPELRVWRFSHYPYLIFYIDYPSQIEIWRVLHSHRDIPSTLQLDI